MNFNNYRGLETADTIELEGMKFVARILKPGFFKNKMLVEAESDELVDIMRWIYKNSPVDLKPYRSYSYLAREIFQTWIDRNCCHKVSFALSEVLYGVSYNENVIFEIEPKKKD